MNTIGSAIQSVLEKTGITLTATWRLERRAAAIHYKDLFAKYDIDLVIDVGANEGQFRDFLRDEVNYNGWIASFEPAPEPLAVLRRRVLGDTRWRIFGQALGPERGTRRLHLASHSTLTSFLVPRFDQTQHSFAKRQTTKTVDVDVVRLDDVLPSLTAELSAQRPFLKLDTQGFDLSVLEGAATSIHSVVALQSELSVIPLYEGMPNYVDTIAALSKLGFCMSYLLPIVFESDLRLVEFDCVMVRPRFAKEN